MAWLWTLLILVLCMLPGKDLPKVDVPFVDKWVHFALFGGFTFLWLCTRPVIRWQWLTGLFLVAAGYGSAIELLQGALTFLGRSMEFLDAVADAVGALLGIGMFSLLAAIARRRRPGAFHSS